MSEVLSRAARHGMKWPLPLELTDVELEKILFPEKAALQSAKKSDFECIHAELSKSGVTMTLFWDEYCESCRQ